MCNNTNKPTLDWDKPLQTVDGQDAKLVSDNYRTAEGPQRLVQVEFSNRSMTYIYDKYGSPINSSSTDLTLRNKTRKVTKWYNVYTSGPGGVFFNTREDAAYNSARKLSFLEIRSIEIEVPL